MSSVRTYSSKLSRQKKGDCFTDEQLEEFKETFKLFDKDGDGYIGVKELGTLLRAFGQSPTEADLQNIIDSLEAEGTTSMDFPEFLKLLSRTMKDTEPETELLEAFKILDKEGSGQISSGDLRMIMTTYGETLSSEEVDEMIKEADTNDDGVVDYREFVSIVMDDLMYNL